MQKLYYSKKLTAGAVILISFVSILFYAYSTGITGRTLKNGTGCNCHAADPSTAVTVIINGPDILAYNQTAVYTVSISGGPLVRGGTNIAASSGILNTINADLQVVGDELTHTAPKLPSGDTVTFSFNYTAPSASGQQIIYANGNSVNFNGNNSGDQWNFATNKLVTVVPVIPVEFSSFTAELINNDVHLNWVTATEKNNHGFEILRRSSDQEWEAVGFLKGNGTTNEVSSYAYIDKSPSPGNYFYRLKQIDFNGSIALYDLDSEIGVSSPERFVLQQNYPNPFNPSTVIEFSIGNSQQVQLKVYNLLGQEVATLVSGYLAAGSYKEVFDSGKIKDLSAGVYFYELTAGAAKTVRKMILSK